MRHLRFFVAIVFLPFAAMADQTPTLTCTGKNVVLSVKSPDFGEAKADYTLDQSLYVLSAIGFENEDRYTAYFLDVEADIAPAGRLPGGSLLYNGKNEVGGTFTLYMTVPIEVGNGTTLKQESHGFLTYIHRNLKGKDEPVSCVTK
jgi:hypothetical protein